MTARIQTPAPTGGPVRIIDVAKAAGVTAGTASKALSGSGQLRDSTRERVRAAAAALGFTPDARGRALSSGRSFSIGLLTSDSVGRFTNPIMMGVEDAMTAGDLAVQLCDVRDDPVRERHYVASLLGRRVDGILVTGRRTEPRIPLDVDLPVVYAFSPSQRETDVSVMPDDAEGARMVVDHLVALGRRELVHISGPTAHASASTRALAVAEAAGSKLVMPPLFGGWSEAWGRYAVDSVLEQHPGLDGIICGSDQIARGACDRLRELGRDVPGEISVTGFDNWDVMAKAARPPLTTIDPHLQKLGQVAGQLLLEMINGQTVPGGIRLVAPELVIRASTMGG